MGLVGILKGHLHNLAQNVVVIHYYEDLLFHLRPVRRELEQKECQTESLPCLRISYLGISQSVQFLITISQKCAVWVGALPISRGLAEWRKVGGIASLP